MKKIVIALAVLLLAPTLLCAQEGEGFEHLSPVAHGAGRTYGVTSRGLSAVGLNPALLGYDQDKTFEVQVFPLSAYGLDAGPSFSDASALSGVFNFSNGQISDSARKSISSLLSNGKLSGRGDAEILGISYHLPTVGTFAFTWTTHAGLRTDIPQNFLDFFINAESQLVNSNGNSFSDFDLQGMWYSEYAASFGTTVFKSSDSSSFLNSFSIGGAVKYVSGIAVLQLDPTNSFAYTPINNGTQIKVNYIVHSAFGADFDPKNVPNHFSFGFLTSNQAGSGMGTDLGVAIGLFGTKTGHSALLIGISATDIGSINWTKNATERTADHLSRTLSIPSGGNIKDLNDSLAALSGTLRDVSSFSTPLPSMFRLGMQLDLDAMGVEWGVFVPKIAVEYANGLNSVVGSIKNGRLGAGLTLERTGNVDLRLGGGFVIEQGASDITLGAGITLLKFLSIDVASAHVGEFFKSGSKRTDVALGMRAAF